MEDMALDLGSLSIFNPELFWNLVIRSILNFIVLIIIIRYIYYSTARRKSYLFTYMLIGVTVFFLSFILEKVKMQLGFALGLFAVFGIIRYRTDSIPIKEMTYLFVIIGISILNAISSGVSIAELLFTNVAFIAVVWSGEYFWMYRHESSKVIIYDNLEYIKPSNKKLFLEDIQRRTGLKVSRIEIGDIDFVKSSVKLVIYYFYDKKKIDFYEEKSFDKSKL
ncbi:MAG TPA: DUF4956 domain-containing protein [Bacteroidales bacterium]|jgi:hypothetical protein|nr:DUF4956 domain-containing protein [Bacteroidales bacterium]